MVTSRSPISMRARATRWSWSTASPRPRKSTGSIPAGSARSPAPAGAPSRSTIAGTANPASPTIPPPITRAIMAEDVRALLDHLSIERADVMGYSMGARITAFLAFNHPDRVRAAIFGGLGYKLVDGAGLPEDIALSLEAPSLADISDTDRPHVPRLCRTDEVRSARARGLHPRLAPDADARTGRADPHAGADRGRRQGRHRGSGRQACCADAGCARGRHSRPRPYACRRRQGVQGGGDRFSERADHDQASDTRERDVSRRRTATSSQPTCSATRARPYCCCMAAARPAMPGAPPPKSSPAPAGRPTPSISAGTAIPNGSPTAPMRRSISRPM